MIPFYEESLTMLAVTDTDTQKDKDAQNELMQDVHLLNGPSPDTRMCMVQLERLSV